MNALAAVIIHPDPSNYFVPPKLPQIRHRKNLSLPNLRQLELLSKLPPNPQNGTVQGGKYYKTLLLLLSDDDRMSLSVLCLLYTLVKSPLIDESLLETGGLFPYRRKKAKTLLDALTNSSDSPIQRKTSRGHLRSKSDGVREIKTERDESISNDSNFFRLNTSQSENREQKTGSQSFDDANVTVVEKLLTFLLQNNCRLITLQISTMLLKELVYSQDSPPNITPSQSSKIEGAYKNSIQNLKLSLNGPLKDVFIEIFEQELRTYRQLNFDSLMYEPNSFLLPVPTTPMSGLALPKRLPSGEAEKTQRAIQNFIVLRELKFSIHKIRDDFLPLKEEPVPSIRSKDIINLGQYESLFLKFHRKSRYISLSYSSWIKQEKDQKNYFSGRTTIIDS